MHDDDAPCMSCAGLVGIVPALGMLTTQQNPRGGPIVFPWWQLMLWSLALAFLGVFIAVPLRTQTVIKVRRPQVSSALHCSPFQPEDSALPCAKGLRDWVTLLWQVLHMSVAGRRVLAPGRGHQAAESLCCPLLLLGAQDNDCQSAWSLMTAGSLSAKLGLDSDGCRFSLLKRRLRMQEKLRFPSGTATAKVIRMLHGGAALDEADELYAVCTLPAVGEVRPHSSPLMVTPLLSSRLFQHRLPASSFGTVLSCNHGPELCLMVQLAKVVHIHCTGEQLGGLQQRLCRQGRAQHGARESTGKACDITLLYASGPLWTL